MGSRRGSRGRAGRSLDLPLRDPELLGAGGLSARSTVHFTISVAPDSDDEVAVPGDHLWPVTAGDLASVEGSSAPSGSVAWTVARPEELLTDRRIAGTATSSAEHGKTVAGDAAAVPGCPRLSRVPLHLPLQSR